jgi:hypothetical protein
MKLLTCLLLSFGYAAAAPVVGLVNTGAGLGDGAIDPNWSILLPVQQAVVVNSAVIPGTWLPNTADSKWIWETATGQPTNVTRTFRITFDLTGFDPGTAFISGRWATDNTGLDIILNGVGTGQTSPGFTSWTNFSLNSGFVAGVNTLDFSVNDFGSIAGFRAEFLNSDVTIVPEPSSAVFSIAGLFLAAGLRRVLA